MNETSIFKPLNKRKPEFQDESHREASGKITGVRDCRGPAHKGSGGREGWADVLLSINTPGS